MGGVNLSAEVANVGITETKRSAADTVTASFDKRAARIHIVHPTLPTNMAAMASVDAGRAALEAVNRQPVSRSLDPARRIKTQRHRA